MSNINEQLEARKLRRKYKESGLSKKYISDEERDRIYEEAFLKAVKK